MHPTIDNKDTVPGSAKKSQQKTETVLNKSRICVLFLINCTVSLWFHFYFLFLFPLQPSANRPHDPSNAPKLLTLAFSPAVTCMNVMCEIITRIRADCSAVKHGTRHVWKKVSRAATQSAATGHGSSA